MYNTLYFSMIKKKRKGRRLKPKYKRLFIVILMLIISFIAIPLLMRDHSSSQATEVGKVSVAKYKDLNARHLKHAKANGIKPFSSDADVLEGVKELIREGELEKLEDNQYYMVDNLTHSHPYLTPETIELLDLIGERFQEKLKDNNIEIYHFRITSVLRTKESQKRLSRSNINATSDSSHLYGTTFDISWKNLIRKGWFGKQTTVAHGPAIRLLSQTIGELKKEGKLVVVTEFKEACFHITIAEN